ncbi:MAG TPA: hypothetical protein VFN74_13905 [Chloroflexota bacterium]|jgi:uncharacterized peroxidase-related enzyme|nr:hypothetical protein [Chloroflexota bacterium]
MTEIAANGLPLVEEHEATGTVAEIYADVKRTLGMPVVPNFVKALAISPGALAIYWAGYRAQLEHSTLPKSLSSMILYAIARRNQCEYCSANHELTCLVLGIDESTLKTLVEDLPQLSPERIRVTIEFALKVASRAKNLVRADYDALRAHGVSDEEIVEIIQLAALGSSGDVLADALKVEVDDVVAEALGRQ